MSPPTSSPISGVRMDAATVRRWCLAAVQALGAHRDEIDRLNVYPVPDGDTGTNMLLTLRAMSDALRRERPTALAAAASVIARGALLGARGNSGVILSQFVRGMAEVLGRITDGQPVDDAPGLLARALTRGAERARAGVADPAEGTILTVADCAAQAAQSAAREATRTMEGVAAVSTAAASAAAEAVRRTPEQLEALRRAGVVDAGGRGLSIILDALAEATGGDPAGGARWARHTPIVEGGDTEPEAPHSSGDYSYEVVYLLEATQAAADRLSEALGHIGDSVVIATADDDSRPLATLIFKVHVHVDDVGAAIERGIELGRLRDIEVTRFADQVGARVGSDTVGVVAIAPGDALRDVFEAEGAAVVDSGTNRRPSTAEVLAEIESTGAARVVVLPNDRDCAAVADAAASEARERGIEVAVVPTKSVVQGLAALAVHDDDRYFGDDVMAMAEAAAGTRYAEISVAVREALTMAGTCQPGDVLGLVGADVVTIGDSILGVTMNLLDMLLATGGELVTLVVGRRAPEGLIEDLQADLSVRHPEVETVVLRGGHPDHPVLLGVE